MSDPTSKMIPTGDGARPAPASVAVSMGLAEPGTARAKAEWVAGLRREYEDLLAARGKGEPCPAPRVRMGAGVVSMGEAEPGGEAFRVPISPLNAIAELRSVVDAEVHDSRVQAYAWKLINLVDDSLRLPTPTLQASPPPAEPSLAPAPVVGPSHGGEDAADPADLVLMSILSCAKGPAAPRPTLSPSPWLHSSRPVPSHGGGVGELTERSPAVASALRPALLSTGGVPLDVVAGLIAGALLDNWGWIAQAFGPSSNPAPQPPPADALGQRPVPMVATHGEGGKVVLGRRDGRPEGVVLEATADGSEVAKVREAIAPRPGSGLAPSRREAEAGPAGVIRAVADTLRRVHHDDHSARALEAALDSIPWGGVTGSGLEATPEGGPVEVMARAPMPDGPPPGRAWCELLRLAEGTYRVWSRADGTDEVRWVADFSGPARLAMACLVYTCSTNGSNPIASMEARP